MRRIIAKIGRSALRLRRRNGCRLAVATLPVVESMERRVLLSYSASLAGLPTAVQSSNYTLSRTGYSEWFGASFDDYCRDYVSLWSQYRAIQKVAETRRVRIVNATRGGLLDLFPREPLEKLAA